MGDILVVPHAQSSSLCSALQSTDFVLLQCITMHHCIVASLDQGSNKHLLVHHFVPILHHDALLAVVQILDEFVEAVMSRWPKAVLQFEDFQLPYAHPLLQRYKDQHLVFNDDIQVRWQTARCCRQ